MSISRIELDLKSARELSLVALLVDREDFLKDVEEIRHILRLKTVPYVLPRYPLEEANHIADLYKNGLYGLFTTKLLLERLCLKDPHTNFYKLDKTLASASAFSEHLLTKYKKDRFYLTPMLCSILVGKIEDSDFSPFRVIELSQETLTEELVYTMNWKRNPEWAIVVNSETSLEAITELFRDMQKYYLGTKKVAKNEPLPDTTIPKVTLRDTISEIKNARDWYWLNKEGLGYAKIRKGLEDGGYKISLDGVKQAIIRYKRKIAVPI